jgi:Spy/CpxP family protein refolding chaperone
MIFTPARKLLLIFSAVALMVVAGGITSRVSAQDNPPAGEMMPEGQNQQLPELGQLLNLSPDQRRQLFAINQRTAPEFRRARQRMQQARKELDDAIYGDEADEALVAGKVQQFNQAQGELERMRTIREFRIRQILTPEQLATVRDIRIRAQKRFEESRRANGGGTDQPAPNDRRQIPPGDNQNRNNNPAGTNFRPRQTQPAPVKRP